MDISKFIELLKERDCNPQKADTGWTARCPAHDDHNPSLSCDEGEDGKILLKCFAGCEFEEIIEALGIGPRDCFPEARLNELGTPSCSRNPEAKKTATAPKPAKPVTLGEPVKTYDYQDASGHAVFQGCRFEPKTFRQRRSDGNGGWIWNLEGVQRIPYRLPELILAVRDDKTIFICEGEKDVDAVMEEGMAATCNAGGAGKWQPEFSDYLRDADVVIIADKDEPGRKHAQKVAASFRGKANSIKIIELPDSELGNVKDAHDWIQFGGNAQAMQVIVDNSKVWDVEPDSLDNAVPQITLPSGDVTITDCAQKLFGLIAPTKRLFVRGGAVVVLVKRDDGLLALEILHPAAARSLFEKFATLLAWRIGRGGALVLKPDTCAQQMADALLRSKEANELPPRVQGLINCPVLREIDGTLDVAGCGYDDRTRLLITGG